MGEPKMFVLKDDYRNSLFAALAVHIFLIIMLCCDSSSNQPPVLMKTASVSAAPIPNVEHAINAISVDQNEVMKTMQHLKQERLNQQRAEQNRQRELQRQLVAAKQQRIKEQQHLAALKKESEVMAALKAKQLVEESQRLKHLAELKQQAEKQRVALEQEALKQQKLAQQKQAAEKAKQIELAKAKVAQQQAAQKAAQDAQIAGEVNKYKALILTAIGRQWILPENANSSLSSQFRIRLAPNGAVLSVALTRSSGDQILDRSAQSAIYKASPLPVPHDAIAFNLFRDINLTVRPIRGLN